MKYIILFEDAIDYSIHHNKELSARMFVLLPANAPGDERFNCSISIACSTMEMQPV